MQFMGTRVPVLIYNKDVLPSHKVMMLKGLYSRVIVTNDFEALLGFVSFEDLRDVFGALSPKKNRLNPDYIRDDYDLAPSDSYLD